MTGYRLERIWRAMTADCHGLSPAWMQTMSSTFRDGVERVKRLVLDVHILNGGICQRMRTRVRNVNY